MVKLTIENRVRQISGVRFRFSLFRHRFLAHYAGSQGVLSLFGVFSLKGMVTKHRGRSVELTFSVNLLLDIVADFFVSFGSSGVEKNLRLSV